jgi:glycosyltransferase involved in cell wall biosynthesis
MVADSGTTRRVLHVVPPNGGGVDRFVRDLCRARPADWIVHAGDAQCVVEWPAREIFLPLPAATLADLAFGGALGRPQAVHAHGTVGAVRQLCETLCAAMRAPCVLTLHDINFADPAATPFEAAQRLRFARAAVARTAPSGYIEALALQALGPGAPSRRVENGVDAWPGLDAAARATDADTHDAAGSEAGSLARADDKPPGKCAVAVIGAIGEHKGLSALLEVAAALPAGLRVVVLGYTAEQLLPGWVLPGRVWMHGAFQPAELPALVARYGVRIAFFPPGMPESYCYALSDAWLAGLAAAVPDQGALAERVRRHGGGRCYDPRLPAPALAAWLAERVTSAGTPAAAAEMASVQHMVRAMNAIYQDCGGDAADDAAADEATLRVLAQPHLDTQFFRKELLNLQGRLEALAHAHEHRGERIAQLEAQAVQTSQQAARLQHEADAARQAFEALRAQHDTARAAHDELAQAHAALQAEQLTLQAAHEALQRRHGALTAWLARPLRWLPAPLRERVLRAGRRRLD